MQMHGSILPKMVIPLLILGGWASFITCVTELTDVKRTFRPWDLNGSYIIKMLTHMPSQSQRAVDPPHCHRFRRQSWLELPEFECLRTIHGGPKVLDPAYIDMPKPRAGFLDPHQGAPRQQGKRHPCQAVSTRVPACHYRHSLTQGDN